MTASLQSPIKTHQSVNGTANKNRINKTIADTPKLIRVIRHHNPQANLQVGLTSLSICSFSFSCFLQIPNLPID